MRTRARPRPTPPSRERHPLQSTDNLVGGSYNGLISFFDLRKPGATVGHAVPLETSVIEKSHHDPVYDVFWISSKTGGLRPRRLRRQGPRGKGGLGGRPPREPKPRGSSGGNGAISLGIGPDSSVRDQRMLASFVWSSSFVGSVARSPAGVRHGWETLVRKGARRDGLPRGLEGVAAVLMSRGTGVAGNQCASVSTDGQMMWWDTRRLGEPTDTVQLATDSKGGGMVLGGSSMEYNQEAGPTKYLVGTEQGIVLQVCGRRRDPEPHARPCLPSPKRVPHDGRRRGVVAFVTKPRLIVSVRFGGGSTARVIRSKSRRVWLQP